MEYLDSTLEGVAAQQCSFSSKLVLFNNVEHWCGEDAHAVF
jgi:hypothetical protein